MPVFFGDNSAAASSPSSLSSKAGAAPQFPLFLLPALKIPFRRRRSSPPSAAAAFSPAPATLCSEPPSLSSSPGSLPGSPGLSPASPTDPPAPCGIDGPGPGVLAPAHLARTAPDTLRCSTCAADLAYGAQVVSKGFTGRHGRAYLVSAPGPTAAPSCPASPVPPSPPAADSDGGVNLVNIKVGRNENRQLVTGQHVVADVTCAMCGVKVGWKYVDAREPAQKYKIGKFILETERVVAYRSWEDVAVPTHPGPAQPYPPPESPERRRPLARDGGGGIESPAADGHSDAVMFDSEDEEECEDIFAGVWDAKEVARRRGRRVGLGRKGG